MNILKKFLINVKFKNKKNLRKRRLKRYRKKLKILKKNNPELYYMQMELIKYKLEK